MRLLGGPLKFASVCRASTTHLAILLTPHDRISVILSGGCGKGTRVHIDAASHAASEDWARGRKLQRGSQT